MKVVKWDRRNQYQDETKVTSLGLDSALVFLSLSSCSYAGTLDSVAPVEHYLALYAW